MNSKYRKPPLRNCDNCGVTMRSYRILCEPCARDIGIVEDERESLRDFRKRVIETPRCDVRGCVEPILCWIDGVAHCERHTEDVIERTNAIGEYGGLREYLEPLPYRR